jgi:hypothetical protein
MRAPIYRLKQHMLGVIDGQPMGELQLHRVASIDRPSTDEKNHIFHLFFSIIG